MTGHSFLERTFLPALPELEAEWRRTSQARPAGEEPDAPELLDAVTRELQRLAIAGRVAEVGRVLRIVERLLEESDPVLEGLLAEHIVRPLAESVGRGELDAARVVPFLGRRARAEFEAWRW